MKDLLAVIVMMQELIILLAAAEAQADIRPMLALPQKVLAALA